MPIYRHRSHQPASAEPVQQDPATDHGATEPNIYQNIILLTVNEQPIYTKVEFAKNVPIYSAINDDRQRTPEVVYSTVVVPAAVNNR